MAMGMGREVPSEYRFCRSVGEMMQPRIHGEYSRKVSARQPEVVTERARGP